MEFLDSASLLLWSTPSVSAEPLFLEALSRNLNNGMKALIFVTDRSLITFLRESEYYIKDYINKSMFIRDVRGLLKKNAKELIRILNEEINLFKGDCIVCFNNISILIDEYGAGFVKELNKSLRQASKSLCIFTQWPYGKGVIDSIKSVFTNIAYIGRINNYNYCINNENTLFYQALKGERVTPVSPKLLVNKNDFIESVSKTALITDELSRNFRISKGFVDFNGLRFDVINGDFKQMIDLLSEEPINPLIIINPKEQESLIRAHELINYSLSKGLMPVVGVKGGRLHEQLRVPVVNLKGDEGDVSLILKKLIRNY